MADAETIQELKILADIGDLRYLDLHLARFISSFSGNYKSELALAAAALSAAVGKGDLCINIEKDIYNFINNNNINTITAKHVTNAILESAEEAKIIGKGDGYQPLVLNSNKNLYFQRYWNYQNRIADFLRNRVIREDNACDLAHVTENIEILFEKDSRQKWQKVAAAMALLRNFLVITGGPGTGKTTVVVKVLALLQMMAPTPLKINLAAPTGKAANRLTESIKEKRATLPVSDKIKMLIPSEVNTIHRLLGARFGSSEFIHNRDNKLTCDLLVIDEASMIDVSLMAKLIDACKEQTAIILLGDMYQLSSVEAGSVLADICIAGINSGITTDTEEKVRQITNEQINSNNNSQKLPDAVVSLQHSYRFSSDSGIGQLAEAVNNGNIMQVKQLLEQSKYNDICYNVLAEEHALIAALDISPFTKAVAASDPQTALKQIFSCGILCSHKEGIYGVENINRRIEERLQTKGVIHKDEMEYHGRPIMITSNSYRSGLFNGDIGIIWHDKDCGFKAWFLDQQGQPISFYPRQLPKHTTVYAMTIHKSQGSEFDFVEMILPEVSSDLLTREIVYTGITRAKKKITIHADKRVLFESINRKITRKSGLADIIVG